MGLFFMKPDSFSIINRIVPNSIIDRPDDCKHYPVKIEQMVADECEMIELRDLDNPKQAQKALDKLMIDSRPSVS